MASSETLHPKRHVQSRTGFGVTYQEEETKTLLSVWETRRKRKGSCATERDLSEVSGWTIDNCSSTYELQQSVLRGRHPPSRPYNWRKYADS